MSSSRLVAGLNKRDFSLLRSICHVQSDDTLSAPSCMCCCALLALLLGAFLNGEASLPDLELRPRSPSIFNDNISFVEDNWFLRHAAVVTEVAWRAVDRGRRPALAGGQWLRCSDVTRPPSPGAGLRISTRQLAVLYGHTMCFLDKSPHANICGVLRTKGQRSGIKHCSKTFEVLGGRKR